MKIVVALDSFKGSISASDACNAVISGIHKCDSNIECIACPISDGGEGFIDSLAAVLQHQGYEIKNIEVLSAYQQQVNAKILVKDESCIIEMAQSCGLELQDISKRRCLHATSYGLGQVVSYALSLGCTDIKIGLGGSATNDGGIGFAQALGAIFYDQNDNKLDHILTAQDLALIAKIDASACLNKFKNVKVVGTCDVANPLIGDNGATYIFGPQKGMKDGDLQLLENAMQNYARVLVKDLNSDFINVSGAGAAGGMGAALMYFCNAQLERGIEVVLDTLDFDQKLQDANLVIVGEGCMDGQSAKGKAPVGVAAHAKKYNLPVIGLCGCIKDDANILYKHNIDAIFSICNKPMNLQESMQNAYTLLEKISENLSRFFLRFNS